MAKKKAEATPAASSVEKDILKDFGDIIVSGSYVADRPSLVIPVSPKLDMLVGGGIKEGSFVIPTGPPKVGKTSMALDFTGTALGTPSEHCNKREAFFFSIEGRLQPRDLMGIRHLKPFLDTTFHVIQSKPGQILNGENFLDIGERLINEKPGCIFIFDSFSQLCSEARKKERIGKRFRDDMPLFLADFCKRICNVIPINGSIVFGITHLIANQGMGMSPWSEASGRKIQYAVDYKLKATHDEDWKSGDAKVGQKVHWQCHASPLHNGSCQTKTTSYLRYGLGIDKGAELVEVCVDLRLIKKSGSWYSLADNPEIKAQGLDKMAALLNEDQKLFDKLNKSFREMMAI